MKYHQIHEEAHEEHRNEHQDVHSYEEVLSKCRRHFRLSRRGRRFQIVRATPIFTSDALMCV